MSVASTVCREVSFSSQNSPRVDSGTTLRCQCSRKSSACSLPACQEQGEWGQMGRGGMGLEGGMGGPATQGKRGSDAGAGQLACLHACSRAAARMPVMLAPTPCLPRAPPQLCLRSKLERACCMCPHVPMASQACAAANAPMVTLERASFLGTGCSLRVSSVTMPAGMGGTREFRMGSPARKVGVDERSLRKAV